MRAKVLAAALVAAALAALAAAKPWDITDLRVENAWEPGNTVTVSFVFRVQERGVYTVAAYVMPLTKELVELLAPNIYMPGNYRLSFNVRVPEDAKLLEPVVLIVFVGARTEDYAMINGSPIVELFPLPLGVIGAGTLTNLLDKSREEVKQLNATVAALKAENARLQSENARLREEVGALKGNVTALASENARLKDELQAARSQYEALRTQYTVTSILLVAVAGALAIGYLIGRRRRT